MATAFINNQFHLMRILDPTLYPFYSDNPVFSPNLISISETGYGSRTNQYSGVFEQAEDGTISGTITGVMGFSHIATGASHRVTQVDQYFSVTGLNLDFEDFYANLQIIDETLLPAEEILFAGDDHIYSDPLSGKTGPKDIHGYDGNDWIGGDSATDERLFGDAGNDTLFGFGGDDTLVGGAGDDLLEDRDGPTRFEGGAGDDTLQGGHTYGSLDKDIAAYQGDAGDYTINLNAAAAYGGGHSITDRVADRDGTDVLIDIDQLAFLDRDFDLELIYDAAYLSRAEMVDLAVLYIAYFDRAPDAYGLFYWAAQMEEGLTLNEISNLFAASVEAAETSPLYGPSEDVVTAVYTNVLNRAVDDAGLAFWAGMLKDDLISRGDFILEVLRGAQAGPTEGESAETTAQRAADAAYLEAKVNLGLYFAAEKGMSNVDDAQDVFDGFDGSSDSIAAGKLAVDAFYADATAADSGELLIQMSGILDDPFYI